MIGVGEFFRSGLYESGGITFNRPTGEYEGWGQSFQRKGNIRLSRTGSAAKPIRNMLGSGFRAIGGPVMSLATGWQEEGLWGMAKWGVAEVVASGFAINAASIGFGSEGAATVGGMVGTMFGPGGYVAGSAIGATAGFTGLALGGMAIGGVAIGAGATYLAAKGSFELLKAGYGHRKRMQTKIDTAGSTAAFMTKPAFTMRQRSVEAIRSNQLSVRSAFGNEANRQSFSSYRKWGNPKYY